MSQKLKSIIAHYRKWKKNNPDLWMIHCSNQKEINDAIVVAAMSKNAYGKKHQHQYRLKTNILELFSRSLVSNSNNIKSAVNFEQLLSIIENSKVPGIGDLAIYDTAVRIGAYLELYPNRIYLHAGTRIGASKLLGVINSNSITKEQLPSPLRESDLSCYEIEDLLCIYKRHF